MQLFRQEIKEIDKFLVIHKRKNYVWLQDQTGERTHRRA
jgi:hypothetical protein